MYYWQSNLTTEMDKSLSYILGSVEAMTEPIFYNEDCYNYDDETFETAEASDWMVGIVADDVEDTFDLHSLDAGY